MAEYKENTRQRRPFPVGTKVDVLLRGADRYHGVHSQQIKSPERPGVLEVRGAIVGPEGISDWKHSNHAGDVLAYRKHEESSNE